MTRVTYTVTVLHYSSSRTQYAMLFNLPPTTVVLSHRWLHKLQFFCYLQYRKYS